MAIITNAINVIAMPIVFALKGMSVFSVFVAIKNSFLVICQ